MRKAIAVLGPGAAVHAGATITLAAHQRHRRRIRMVDDDGVEFLLDLPNAVHLKDGDGLGLEGGGVIRVIAANEEVADLACATPELAVRIGWHIGNRHVPVQVMTGGVLRVPADHVLLPLMEKLGAAVTRRRAPFQPEPGAYDPHGLMEAPPPVVRRA